MINAIFLILLAVASVKADDFTLTFQEINDPDGTKYVLGIGGGHFHRFSTLEQIEAFANVEYDNKDPEFTRLVRALIKKELESRSVDKLVEDLAKTEERYTVTKEAIKVEKNEEIIR